MATGTFFFDSSGLADYLQGYPNSSIEYGDDYMFALTYHSSKELIDLIEYTLLCRECKALSSIIMETMARFIIICAGSSIGRRI